MSIDKIKETSKHHEWRKEYYMQWGQQQNVEFFAQPTIKKLTTKAAINSQCNNTEKIVIL